MQCAAVSVKGQAGACSLELQKGSGRNRPPGPAGMAALQIAKAPDDEWAEQMGWCGASTANAWEGHRGALKRPSATSGISPK